MKGKIERRFLNGIELRTTGAGKLEGYGAVFNSPSEDLGGFTETILPGAFERAIREGQNVLCLFNHNVNFVLGRTKSGTLRLVEDRLGLNFECDLPASQTGRDLHTLVERGDINGCSFSFAAVRDAWSRDGKRRELQDVDLFDVGPVTSPAYLGTSVSARSLWPDGVPLAVAEHQDGGPIAGCYRATRSRIFIPAKPAPDLEMETERCRARLRLAGLEF
jgi:hypothetical protein